MMPRKLLCLFALSIPACAHQSRPLEQPRMQLRELCSEPATSSLCAPLSDAPLVDTNLATPAQRVSLVG